MKNFTAKIKLVFGKKNTVVYSTFLIVCIIGIIFFNTLYGFYSTPLGLLINFNKNANALTFKNFKIIIKKIK